MLERLPGQAESPADKKKLETGFGLGRLALPYMYPLSASPTLQLTVEPLCVRLQRALDIPIVPTSPPNDAR